jgi:hypothetical protein
MPSKKRRTGPRVAITSLHKDLICHVFGFLFYRLSEVCCLLRVHKAWNFDVVFRVVRALDFWIHVRMHQPFLPKKPYHFQIADWFRVPSRWRTGFRNLGIVRESKYVKRMLQAMPLNHVYDIASVGVLDERATNLCIKRVCARELIWDGQSAEMANLHIGVTHLVLNQLPRCWLGECPGVTVLEVDLRLAVDPRNHHEDPEPFFSASTFPNIQELHLHLGDYDAHLFLNMITRVTSLEITTFRNRMTAHCVRTHFASIRSPPALRHLTCSLEFFNGMTDHSQLPNALVQLQILHLEDLPNPEDVAKLTNLQELHADMDQEFRKRMAHLCPQIKLTHVSLKEVLWFSVFLGAQ